MKSHLYKFTKREIFLIITTWKISSNKEQRQTTLTLLLFYIYLLCVCTLTTVPHRSTEVKVKGQLEDVGSLLPGCQFQYRTQVDQVASKGLYQLSHLTAPR